MSTKAMHLTFVGHQTWHISDGRHSVLLDPVVCRAFGPTGVPFEVWPPRDVDTTAMPAPTALILSHEHLDHFHLPSLARLDRDIPLYTGMTVPAAVTEAIEALGFTVHRRDFTEPLLIGDLEITLYPAGATTMFWESRVVQPLIRLAGAGGAFIGVDADLSDTYLTHLEHGTVPLPDMAIVSNNSQSVPYGAPSTDTNLLPGLDGPHQRATGLHVLHSLLEVYLAPLTGVPHVALCGNGFTAPLAPHGPFLYGDHRALAEHANALQHVFTVHGPRPGDVLTLAADGTVTHSTASWITPDLEAETALTDKLAAFLDDGPQQVAPVATTAALDPDTWDQADRLLTAELPRLARALLTTRTGTLALGMGDYLAGEPLGSQRLALRLLDPPGRPGQAQVWMWDITGPTFVRQDEPTSREQDMARVPFGLELFHQDMIALLEGRAQIWDIMGGSSQGWHVGDPLDSPVYAFLGAYGEHQRPDLAAACYTRSLAELGVTSTPRPA